MLKEKEEELSLILIVDKIVECIDYTPQNTTDTKFAIWLHNIRFGSYGQWWFSDDTQGGSSQWMDW